jgi:hypothetical protein
MPRLQFGIRTLLWLTLIVAAFLGVGLPLTRSHAPRWGKPTYELRRGGAVELQWPTGRVEVHNQVTTETIHLLNAWPDEQPASGFLPATQLCPTTGAER